MAVRCDERIYVQVCRQLPEESDREVANLLEVKDHYPKYVVTLDDLARRQCQRREDRAFMPIPVIRWDLLIMSVYHGAAPESAFAHRTEKGDVTDE